MKAKKYSIPAPKVKINEDDLVTVLARQTRLPSAELTAEFLNQ
jgi:hypothetical protein